MGRVQRQEMSAEYGVGGGKPPPTQARRRREGTGEHSRVQVAVRVVPVDDPDGW